jgi:hypothetical protein
MKESKKEEGRKNQQITAKRIVMTCITVLQTDPSIVR